MKKKNFSAIFLSFIFALLLNSGFCATYYVSKTGSDSNDGTSWASSLLNINTALSKAESGDSVWVGAGTYIEGSAITIYSAISLYGGFEGTETDISQRNISANRSIIDGNNKYLCLNNSKGTVDGFFVTKGIRGISNTSGTIRNCFVYANSSPTSVGGIYNNSGTIINCVVYANSALGSYSGDPSPVRGGGIYTYNGEIINCVVYSNSASGFNSMASGIYISSGSIKNCIIWNNKNGGDVLLYKSIATITNSCFAEADGTNGNIRANPLFVNTSGDISTYDFHLQNSSPCIDSGLIESAPATDIEGNSRPGGDGLVDMGAYESSDNFLPGTPFIAKRFYVSKSGDNSDGLSWDTAFNSIKTAIDSVVAVNDDNLYEIWTAKGTYKESRTISNPILCSLVGGFEGTETKSNQRNIELNPTIIDRPVSYSVGVINFGILDSFHVTNCSGAVENYGGIVIDCKLYSNKTEDGGGGIRNIGGIVENCLAYSNTSEWGSGVYNYYGKVKNSIMHSNSYSTTMGTEGSGVYNENGIVTNCQIYSNTATSGGGIYNIAGIITNCAVYSNSAEQDGGGIYSAASYSNIPEVSNCISYSNSAKNGGGIWNSTGAIKHCTVEANSASVNGGGIYNGSGKITNSIIWNNNTKDVYFSDVQNISYSCFGESPGTDGNIKSNPLFVNTSGNILTWDFHLRDGSVCIDSGTTLTTVSADIENNPRPGGDGKVDMGAYESTAEYLPGKLTPPKQLYVSKTGSNTDGLSWETAFTTIQGALTASTGDDLYEIWAAAGTYTEAKTITISGKCSLYGGFAGDESKFDERDIIKNKTIIDGNNSYQCAINNGMLDGFYITKGKSTTDSGGILNSGVIKYCSVYANSGLYGGVNNKWIISNSKIYSNTSSSSSGGIYNSPGTTKNSAIYLNSSTGSGGGIYNNSGDVINCAIYANSSASTGGGIYDSSGNVRNCSIYANSSKGFGGGLFCSDYGIFTNCIIWKNTKFDVYLFSANAKISNSCFLRADGTNGNIEANPLFVNTGGDISTWDFHLQNGSECIDSGNTANSPDEDIEGNPRPGGDGKIDMGAYESPDDYLPGVSSSKLIYVSKTGDNSDGESWDTAFTSIKKALSTDTGDYFKELWIAEGTYKEGAEIVVSDLCIVYGGFAGNETTIDDRVTTANLTIIDGENLYRCVTNSGKLDSLCITKGKSTDGGGVYNSYGKIINCAVYSNSATEDGGGIYNEHGTISSSASYSNSSLYSGAGVYNNYGTVSDCSIYSNLSEQGGGVYNNSGYIMNSLIYMNTVSGTYAEGGGIYDKSYGNIANCKIYLNSSAYSGGGIDTEYGTISNCILYSNSASSTGGGMSTNYSKINNCVLYANKAGTGGGIYCYKGSVTNCIAWNNPVGADIEILAETYISYSCYGGSDGKNGNISANPLFVNTNGDVSTYDFHLQNGSLCIDSGKIIASVTDDFEGNPRPGGDGKVDMGAYESPDEYEQGAPPAIKRIYVSESGDNTDGTSWSSAFTSIKQALNSLDDNFYEIWTAKGTYIEGATISIPFRAYVYGGFEGNETSIEQRNPAANKTVISGNNNYRCALNRGIIDGFQISGGTNARNGGGVYNVGTVNNCIICQNTGTTAGGGAYNNKGYIKNSSIYSNKTLDTTAVGGGVENYYGSVINCKIYTNSSSDNAGGIENYFGQVINSVIYSNSSVDYGGGAYNYNGQVINSTIYSNSSNTAGGGIYNDSGTIMNSTFYNNYSSSNGDGVYSDEGTITNSIFRHHQGDDIYYIFATDISFSRFKEADGTNGNISADPLFVNISGDISTWDFRLQFGSPCKDSGIPTNAPADDILGTARPQLLGFDMGAYEYALPQGDVNSDGKVDSSDVQMIRDYLCEKISFSAQQKQLADYNRDGLIDIADLVALLTAI